MIKDLVHICDVGAIPLFALLSYYFYRKKNKTDLENFLYLFAITGLIMDSIFTYNFLNNKL
jgi:hypothetical protein